MKIILTEREMINIVATLNEQNIKLYASGEYSKWKGEKCYSLNGDERYEFEYKYDSKGNLKENNQSQEIKDNLLLSLPKASDSSVNNQKDTSAEARVDRQTGMTNSTKQELNKEISKDYEHKYKIDN